MTEGRADDRVSTFAVGTTVAETRASGLSDDDVATRIALGQTNVSGERTSRTFNEILRANIITRFNLLLAALLAAIVAVGQLRDALFGIVLVANALIGIVQELRAKRVLDRLVILNAPRAVVWRDGADRDVAVEEVVLDDLVSLRTGDQIVADGIVRASTGLQVDESLLTGEADPIDKALGESVLSGSFVVAGAGRYQATAVGPDAHARKIATEARRFTPARSELMDGINRILRYVTWAVVPVAVMLLVSQLHAGKSLSDAVSSTVAGLVGMVPQGLVLLTSISFGVGAVTLARRNVLVQELPAIEALARVDVVCFDKTGTLTDGSIIFDEVERIDGSLAVDEALGALADDVNANATLAAIGHAFSPPDGWSRVSSIPFSSVRKWSAASFGTFGTWVLGAPEMVLSAGDPLLERATALAASGRRILVLAYSRVDIEGDELPGDVRAAAFVLFAERVRDDAAATLAYFTRQGVAIKVISGDHPFTVASVARRVGMVDAEKPVDARDLPDDVESLGELLEERSVFGRVTPRQKQAMVTALQAKGHTVAMTGDGVNDALALKLADIGIAMGSGAPTTRAVARLVLLDGRFETLPEVVAEGRRITANIERVANLFVVKTVWATVLAVAASALLWPYPFLPRHLTIIDSLTIGIPAFFLALAPNLRRYVPGFVNRVLRNAVPAGLVLAATVFTAYALARSNHLSLIEQRTSATLVALILSVTVLVIVALPLTWPKAVLVGSVVAGFALLFSIDSIRSFYALQLPADVATSISLIGIVGIVGIAMIVAMWVIFGHIDEGRPGDVTVDGG